LQEEKALKKASYDNAKNEMKKANDEEEKYKKNLGKVQHAVVSKVESILSQNHIEKPYYHGGKYNGNRLIDAQMLKWRNGLTNSKTY
jgi:hypothetical protein